MLERLQERYPAFVARCEQLGCRYSCYLAAEADASKGAGRGWRSFWKSATREEAEERMRSYGYSYAWVEGEGGEEVLRCTTPVLQCVRTAPGTSSRVFFNQLVAQITNASEWAARAGMAADDPECLGRFLTFGDGSPMEVEPLLYARDVGNESAIEINWQERDVALLDNYLLMHARRPFEGPRQILASLVL